MKLNAAERVVLLSSLPDKYDILSLKIVRQLRESLSFSEQEFKDFGLHSQGGGTSWDPVGNTTYVDFEIGERATEFIVQTLKRLSEENQLTDGHWTLCEKFGLL